MSNYKVYDGTKWLDPCWHHIYIRDNAKTVAGDKDNKWVLLDPHNRDIYYHDGTYGKEPSMNPNFPTWKPIKCICYCNEAAGFFYDSTVQRCVKKEYTNPTCEGDCNTVDIKKVPSNLTLGKKGLLLWNTEPYNSQMLEFNQQGITLNTANLESNTPDYAFSPFNNLMNYAGYKGIKNKVWGGAPTFAGFNRINSVGIWPDGYTMSMLLKKKLVCPAERTFIFGMGSKYGGRFELWDNTTFTSKTLFEIPANNTGQHDYWHTFPVTFPAGTHEIYIWGYYGATNPVLGAEIYDINVDTFKALFGKNDIGSLITKDDIPGLNNFIVFSTKDYIQTPFLQYSAYEPQQVVSQSFDCPEGYIFSSELGFPTCIKRTEVECADGGISDEPTSNEVLFTIKADYLVLTYKFLKNASDSWILDDGSDLYDTPYTYNGVTKPVRDDIQGRDLDTHTRLYAGPNENNPIIDTHYFGWTGRIDPGPAPGTTVFPNYKRDGVTPTIGYDSNQPVIPMDGEFVLLHSGDNTGTGAESVLINIKELKARFGAGGINVGTTDPAKQIADFIEEFNVEMRAWWWTTGYAPTRYPVGMTAKFYTDDTANGNPITALSLSNYNFVVTGGIETILTTPPVIVANNINGGNPGGAFGSTLYGDLYYNGDGYENSNPPKTKRINVLNYNFVTGVGKFVNNNTTLNPPVGNASDTSVQKPSNI